MMPEYFKDQILISSIVNFAFWAASFAIIAFIYRAPLYHPLFIYHIYHFLGFVYRPYIIWSTGYSHVWERTGVFPTSTDIFFETAVANLALASIMGGFFLVTSRSQRVPLLRPAQVQATRPIGLAIAVVILLMLGIYGTAKSYAGVGLESLQAYEVSVDSQGGQQLIGVSGYATALAEFLPAVCIILFIIPKTRKLSYLIIATYVALRLYVGAQRLSFVVVLAAVFFITQANARRRYPTKTVLACILMFAVLFDLIGGDRFALRKLYYGETTISQIQQEYVQERGSNGLTSDLVEYDVCTAVLALVPDRTGWSYGTQYLRLLLWPIPRQLWPDKPVYTSRINLNDYGYFYGLTHTLYADAYMVAGLPSMIVILTLIGAYLARLYEIAATTKNLNMLMYFWLQTIYLQTLFRDGEVTVFYFLGFSMIAVVTMVTLGGLRLCR